MLEPADGRRRPAWLALAGWAALAVVLFCVPLMVGVVAEAQLPRRSASITWVLAVLAVVTVAFGLLHALVLMKINRARRRAWSRDLLPYLLPLAALGFLTAVAPWSQPTLTTVVAGMAAFVAYDAAWFATSIRRAVRDPAAR